MINWKRVRLSTVIAVCLMAGACLLPVTAAAQDTPNIVLLFCDDLGYGDPSCYGNTAIETPNVDRLAASGQRWTSFYAAGCVCVPSRTGLMTGKYPARIYGEQRIQAALPTEEVTMAEMLRSQGYRTALLGKWHLGMEEGRHPNDQGFDYYYGTPSSNDHFRFPSDRKSPPGKGHVGNQNNTWEAYNVPLYRQKEIVEQPAQQPLFTQRYTEEAAQWIQENREHPFFLYVAYNMPHTPIARSDAFKGVSRGGRYGDVIEELDWSVGKIVNALEQAGLSENTLVIFTSDNGPWHLYPAQGGSSRPLRNGKGTCWEGAFRVPAIFNWPGKIRSGVVNDMGAGLDLYATFATLASAYIPANRNLDSQDLSDVLLHGAASPRKSWMYYKEDGILRAARVDNYKIHLSSVASHRAEVLVHEPPLLYDLTQDVAEQYNIASRYPDVVKSIRTTMDDFRKELPNAEQ
jgi:arylsulfatase A